MKLNYPRCEVEHYGDLLPEIPKSCVAVYLDHQLAAVMVGSVLYGQWIECFSLLESTMRGHIAGALDLCLMDKVLEDLNRPRLSMGVLALFALEN